MKKFTILAFIILLKSNTYAQVANILGKVTGGGEILVGANVVQKGANNAAVTNETGEYRLQMSPNKKATIVFSYVGFKPYEYPLRGLEEGATLRLDVQLVEVESKLEVTVKARRIDEAGMVRERVKELKLIPTASGNFESVLPAIALGTNAGSGGELSSQYNVRGGNYDENLVYVNDFEIYRPQLIRAGQQEGLSFPNIDLMRDLSFSSGGFEARYGDKLSSVLDIKYKRPDSLRSSLSGSLLGASAHIEGSVKLDTGNYRRFRYLVGARYKTTRYLLGSLDIKGEYVPDFTDIQTYLTYDINRDWQVAFLGNFNNSVYNFKPTSRSTAFGLINFSLKLTSQYEGAERDGFTNGMAGISLTYLPEKRKNPMYLKILASSFQSQETEKIDITGKYSLGEIQTSLGADNFGDVVAELGGGTQQQFVRNSLFSRVSNLEHKGGLEIATQKEGSLSASHFFQWGIKAQNELIDDKLKEWERLDSALYSLNYDANKLLVYQYFKTANVLNSNRLSGFFQDTYTKRRSGQYELQATVGLRASYWNLNNDFNITPRAQILLKPLNWDNDAAFRFSAGYYFQPPFYRELRNVEGVVNKDVIAQKSLHFVAGYQQDFFMLGGKRFRLMGEAYYKRLWDLVPYDIENVRIRYSGNNNATGYAYGGDLRINGEFVKGAESWVNFSLLKTGEKLDGVQHQIRELGKEDGINVNYVPRPSDRRFNMAVFFQDYLKKNKNFKVHTMFSVGTGLPFGIPNNNIIFRNPYRMKAYHRVDIGFSYMLFDRSKLERNPHHFLRFTRSTWLSFEAFNLMEVANEANRTWVKTIFRQQFAIPNYLTSRRLNLRLKMEF
jgi:CarboxypepD_reg-like domain/TonB-dependent Receptor Plug Domain